MSYNRKRIGPDGRVSVARGPHTTGVVISDLDDDDMIVISDLDDDDMIVLSKTETQELVDALAGLGYVASTRVAA